MSGECLVIAIIIGVLSFSCFRAKRKNWGFAVLPLLVLPLVVGAVMYILQEFVVYSFPILLPMVLILASLAVSCIWIGISSVILIKTRKMRIPYLIVTVGFDFALALIMLFRYY